MSEAEQLKSQIETANRILITSHISPDPDAICSVLLMGRALKLNYPDKDFKLALEEKLSQDVSFLEDYEDIEFGSILETARSFKPDLLTILDASGVPRITRNESKTLANLIYDQLKAKVVVIDHHQEDPSVKADLYIRSAAPATAQIVYELLFDELKLKKPAGYAETALLGILRDTARFKYDNPAHRKTFEIVSDLLDAGASIEKLEYRLDRYKKDELEVLQNLLKNAVVAGEGYTYSFIDDEFCEKWLKDNRPIDAYKAGTDIFSGQFLRNIEDNYWGFVVYPELQSKDKPYSVSFRAVSGGIDVAAIVAKLGGGGHKEAAGAKNIKAESIEEAIELIKQVLPSNP